MKGKLNNAAKIETGTIAWIQQSNPIHGRKTSLMCWTYAIYKYEANVLDLWLVRTCFVLFVLPAEIVCSSSFILQNQILERENKQLSWEEFFAEVTNGGMGGMVQLCKIFDILSRTFTYNKMIVVTNDSK